MNAGSAEASVTPETGVQGAGKPDSRLDETAPAIGSLVRNAARLRGARLALSGEGLAYRRRPGAADGSLTFAGLCERMEADARALAAFGIRPGERALAIGCVSARGFAAVAGALEAGLDVAVAGPHLDAAELGAFAASIGASVMLCEACDTDAGLAEQALAASAAAESVRLVVSLAKAPPDGMVAMDAAVPRGDATGEAAHPLQPGSARIVTRSGGGAPVFHRQETLLMAGFDLVSRAQISAAAPLISTIAPTSFAGLVCGPLAGLLAGASTHLLLPFSGRRLVELVETLKPAQLVAPAAICPQLSASGLCSAGRLSALMLLTRLSAPPADWSRVRLPALDADRVAVSDLLAIGEAAAFAERRTAAGLPARPLQSPHTIRVGDREHVAVRSVTHFLDRNGAKSSVIALEGKAVSQPDWILHDAE